MEINDLIKIIFAQFIIMIFAFIVGYFKLKNEVQKFRLQKKIDLSIERMKNQLSEFYGPLYMMTKATTQIADTAWGTDIWDKTFKEILVPSQIKIEEILLTKIHLLDEIEIPTSYFDFLHHVRVARNYLDTGLNPDYFKKGTYYPEQFNIDVEISYQKKRKEYIDYIKDT